MIDPPVITNTEAKDDYLRAVQTVTKIWQVEVSMRSVDAANARIAKMWPLTFTPEQQQAIIVEFMARRLAR